MINLPYITLDQLLELETCWFTQPGVLDRLYRYVDQLGGRANALDILRISDIPPDDRLRIVLREEMIPATILHEMGCWCADQALSLIDNPDPRSVNAVAVKRRWIRGEATDDELRAAQEAAQEAAWAAVCAATPDATWAIIQDTARAFAWAAAQGIAQDAVRDAVRKAQVQHLINMLEEATQ